MIDKYELERQLLAALKAKRDEAFFHARFFLKMAVKYGEELDEAPSTLPSGWAALLYLYNLR